MRDEKRCASCRGPLHETGRGRPPVYCSRACQARAYRRRAHPPVAEPGRGSASGLGVRQTAVSDGSRTRRRQIAEAVWRIAADRGLHEASMREVAAAAGVSLRVVQYHFRSKHELLVAALHLLLRDNERRAARRIRADPADPRALLRAFLDEFLPLDAHRRTALRVLAAYYARSLTDPELAAVFLHGQHPLEDIVAAVLADAQRTGLAPADLDVAAEADLLVSAAVSLGGDVLHGTRSLAAVRRVFDYHLTRLLPGAGTPRAPDRLHRT